MWAKLTTFPHHAELVHALAQVLKEVSRDVGSCADEIDRGPLAAIAGVRATLEDGDRRSVVAKQAHAECHHLASGARSGRHGRVPDRSLRRELREGVAQHRGEVLVVLRAAATDAEDDGARVLLREGLEREVGID